MKRTLKLSGVREAEREAIDLGLGRFGEELAVTVRESVVVATGRAEGGEVRIEADDDDLVEVEFEGGVRQWMRVDELRQELLAGTVARGGDAGDPSILSIPQVVEFGGDSGARGAWSWAIRLFRVLHVDDRMATWGAERIAAHFEGKLDPAPGLYRCPDPRSLGGRIVKASDLEGAGPWLLFLHGTASSTEGSFGKLCDGPKAPWPELRQRYGDRILAFEHRTLSQSPIENVHELLELLPSKAVLHLVSHSRGGLVGELLCRSLHQSGAAIEPMDIAIFKKEGLPRNLKALGRLKEEAGGHQISVERFARVACPARGTLLASKRLDKYLSGLLNGIGLIGGLNTSPTYSFLKAVLLALAKRRNREDTLPGLEAQQPGSALVRMLNRGGIELDADLHAIGGDIEGEGLWKRLAVWASDLYYREPHDLVVQTASMDGGGRRSGGAAIYVDQGGDVNHFSYFKNAKTRARLLAALDGRVDGFEPIVEGVARSAVTSAPRSAFDGTNGVTFVLPGIMGSDLWAGKGAGESDRVWVDVDDLMAGKMARLAIGSDYRVTAKGINADAYQEFVQQLGSRHEVQVFAYDWRLPVIDEARRFGAFVAARIASLPTQAPVRIAAHSMGGLLARAMLVEVPSVWKAMRDRVGSRLVMFGTPNGGSFVVPRTLLGREKILKSLALIDLDHSAQELARIIGEFPGFLDMLPVGNEEHDLFSKETWQKIAKLEKGWPHPTAELLAGAKRFRETLSASPVDPERMIYVAGTADETPAGLRLHSDEVVFYGSPKGDGRVLWANGPLAGCPTYYVPAVHGDMLAHKPSFLGYFELLEKGQTTALSRNQPARDHLPQLTEMREVEPSVLPSQRALVRAAMGSDLPLTVERMRAPKLRASVSHGDLSFSNFAIAVGHYLDDGITNAERVLDRRLGGALSTRHRLGIYPGEEATAEALLPPGRDEDGAIVIGLGRVGGLTPRILRDGIARGVLRYALAMRERTYTGAEERRTKFSSLLIGSQEGSSLGIKESVLAILEGVEQANEALLTGDCGVRPIEEVEFIELYEDRAINTARALAQLGDLVEVPPTEGVLRRQEGGWKQLPRELDPSWWRRVQILSASDEDRSLKFVALTDKARAEARTVATQVELLDDLLRQPLTSSTTDLSLGVTLFELLVPVEFKDSSDERSLVLLLDRESATIPWELMVDRGSDGQRRSELRAPEPLSVQTAMIRQIETRNYRQQIARALPRRALIIGDPHNNHLPALPGARAEASEVARRVQAAGYDVTRIGRLEGDETFSAGDVSTVLAGLVGRGYRILHLAGHGHHEPGKPKESGLVIGTRQQGSAASRSVLLTPAEMRQLREVPDFAFVNCCHLGRLEGDAHPESAANRVALAANLGIELIEMGVRAVIAAGWAVDDRAALRFAAVFYESFLDGSGGMTFGEAVKCARRAIYEEFPTVNTWAAYQCYGDPHFVLATRQSTGRRPDEWVDKLEARIELENLASRARASRVGSASALAESLKRVSHRIGQRGWSKDAGLLSLQGDVHLELGEFRAAIDAYRLALAGETYGALVAVPEQLANALVRSGFEGLTAGSNPPGFAKQARADLDEGLARAIELGERDASSLRSALVASAKKRLARVSGSSARSQALLREALSGYQDAATRAGGDETQKLYAATNAIFCAYLLRILERGAPQAPERFDEHVAETRRIASRDTGPYVAGSRILTEVMEQLVSGRPAADRHAVIELLDRAFGRGMSASAARSLVDQFEILAWALRRGSTSAEVKGKQVRGRKAAASSHLVVVEELRGFLAKKLGR